MFEAADDWRSFAEWVYEGSPYADFGPRAAQEEEFYALLEPLVRSLEVKNPTYERILELGARVIAQARLHKTDPDGYLGVLKAVRQTFGFLETEFGMKRVEHTTYESDCMRVELSTPDRFDSRCIIKQLSEPQQWIWPEGVMLRADEVVSFALPPDQPFKTEEDVQDWMTLVADILKQHATDLLAGDPAAFEGMARLLEEEDRRFTEENDKLLASREQTQ